MYYRVNYDRPVDSSYPHWHHYPRNEQFQGFQQPMNHPYPFEQQEMNQPMYQYEMNDSYPFQQEEMNQLPYQQNPMINMTEQPYMNGNSNQTPFDYFQKPEQPMNWPNNTSFDPSQFQQSPQVPPGIISQFQNENGQLDFDKVLGTVGQMANTYHQVAPIFQQFSSFMKNFRVGG